ncbi:hypothetical protein EZ456_23905 [Pedobacter psychrodurus]|uniref:Carboxypeptidase-like protein n=1 Tax=Pedobacter psychrodurus TaxID=2530456 RepID=A0A4R0PJQ3_9SPHI|nr:hypothetical protein [Pedobacter psychrodurus]TCD16860.1 hypothetical protein EZ456_23905 [Pedobacter psychrodurus]
MYLKHFLATWALLLSIILASAQQTFTINGVVKDSLAVPLDVATIAIVTKNGSGLAFTNTNQQGVFSCKLQTNDNSLSIKVTAMGYEQKIVPISSYTSQSYTIILKKKVNLLKEIKVTSLKKVSLVSDTLIYNVKAFKEQNDRVIADLIGRLPGIKIDDKGAISYNGKPISKVYLDGDNLLDGRYKLATNNVPVNAVEQVQVIERDQPIKALNGYTVTNNVALNLKLTDSARAITINTGHVGLGNKAYTGEFNNMFFKTKIKSINNLKANNLGDNLESENADIGVSYNNEAMLKTTTRFLSVASSETPSLDEKYYLMNNDYAGNINVFLKLKADWTLRFNLATLQLKRKYNFNNSVNYFLNQDTIRYTEIQNHLHTLEQWQIQNQVEKNSNTIYVKSLTKLDMPKWKKDGSTIQNEQLLEQNLPTSYLSVSNETNVIKALGINNIVQYNSLVQYYSANERLNVMPGLYQDMINNGENYLSLEQQVQTKNIFINQSATYKTKFNKFILSAAIGLSYDANKLVSNLYRTDSLSDVAAVGDGFKNDVKFNNLGLFGRASATYLLEKGAIIAEATPTLSFIDFNGKTNIINKENRYFLLNPAIDFRKNLGRYSEISFRYAKQTTFGEVADIYPGSILTNYREFNFNQTTLPKTDINSANIRFGFRKPLAMLFYNFNVGYDRTQQNFINSFIIDNGLTKSTAINFNNIAKKYALGGNISKYLYFASLNVSANASGSLQQGFNFYNNEILPFTVKNIATTLTARKKIFNKITVSVSGEWARVINEQKTLYGKITNTTHIEKLKAIWQHQLNQTLSYNLTYSYTSYKQQLQQAVQNNFLDMTVKFAPLKLKSFFELQCINLINQNNYRQLNSTSNQLMVFDVPLRARTFLLKYTFSF